MRSLGKRAMLFCALFVGLPMIGSATAKPPAKTAMPAPKWRKRIAAPRTIVDFYRLLPADYFDIPREQMLAQPSTILDIRNGYLKVQGDGAQMRLELCLFKRGDGSYVLAISNDGWDDPEFLSLFHVLVYRDGVWKNVTSSLVPVSIDNKLVYRLPRVGRMIRVNHRSGRHLYDLRWTGERFRKI